MPIRSLFRFLRPAVGIDNQAARDRWLEDTLRSIPDGSLPAENGSDADRLCTYTDAVVQ